MYDDTSVISLAKESEALRLKVEELERKAMRQEVKVQERQSSTKKQRLRRIRVTLRVPRCNGNVEW